MAKTPIRFAVLGLNQGSKIARDAALNPRIELVAVAGFGDQAVTVAEELDVKLYEDYNELLEKENLDGVAIALPNSLHVPATEKAVECGVKNILLEKPIANSEEEGQRIIDVCKEAGVKLLVGHHRRSSNRYRYLKMLIDSGKLGKIIGIQSSFAIEKQPDYWDADWHKARTGGPMLVNAIHDIDDLSFVTGLKIKRVYAVMNNTIRGNEAEDSATLVMEYEDGVTASYFISDGTPSPWNYDLSACENVFWCMCPGENSMRIYGTNGSFGFPNMDLYYYEEGKRGWRKQLHKEHFVTETNDPMTAELDHFVDMCIDPAIQPRCTGEDALQAVKIIDAAFKSADTREPVDVI